MKFFFSLLCLCLFSLCVKAQSKIQTVVVTFNQNPTAASSKFAPAKYNKDAVFQMEFDDRVAPFRDVFAYMGGGKASDSIIYPGKTYSDACGNTVNFRAGIGCNGYSNGSTTDLEYATNCVTWNEIRNYLSKDWLPINHGLRHNTTDTYWPGYFNNIAFMHQYMHDSTGGFSCSVWISPNADEGYLPSVESFGYLASTSQSARDGYQAFPPYDWYKYTTIEALPDTFTQFTRNYNYDWSPSNVSANLYPLIDGLLTGNTSTNHKLMRLFSHGEIWSLDGFKMFADYLQTTANDRLWICSFQEFEEYQEIKRKAIKTEVLNSNQLMITLDLSQVPDTAHFKDLSLLVNVSGANITNVSVSGADRYSYNASSGLINIFNRRKYNSDSVVNQPPVADAGADTTIILPVNNVILNGSATDADGTIVSYNWSQVSGPGIATFLNAASASTAVNNLIEGTYIFRLTVTDNKGDSASDNVQVTVKHAVIQDTLSITAPPDISVYNDSLKCSASNVSLGTPTISGSLTIKSVSNNAPAVFAVGITVVTWTVTDINNNSSTAVQKVTVTDRERPSIMCLNTASFCYNSGGVYNITPATVTDNCGVQSVSFSITGATTRSGTGNNASGNFNPGTNTITWLVTDVNGNSNTCQSKIIIGNPLSVSIPDAFAINKGADSNTVYIGYTQASSIKLTAKPLGGTGAYTYLWSNGATASSINVNPVITTTYKVVIKDGAGCTAVANKLIKVIDVRCGVKNDMVTICYKSKTNCIKSNTVNSQLNLGAYLGSCPVTNATLSRMSEKQIQLQDASTFNMQCMPNPATSFVTIKITGLNEGSVAQLNIYNSLGIFVEGKKIMKDQTLQLGFNFSDGIYNVELIQGSKRITQKLIILKQ